MTDGIRSVITRAGRQRSCRRTELLVSVGLVIGALTCASTSSRLRQARTEDERQLVLRESSDDDLVDFIKDSKSVDSRLVEVVAQIDSQGRLADLAGWLLERKTNPQVDGGDAPSPSAWMSTVLPAVLARMTDDDQVVALYFRSLTRAIANEHRGPLQVSFLNSLLSDPAVDRVVKDTIRRAVKLERGLWDAPPLTNEKVAEALFAAKYFEFFAARDLVDALKNEDRLTELVEDKANLYEENVSSAALERLLALPTRTKPALLERLVRTHPNLYLRSRVLKVIPNGPLHEELASDRKVPEWVRVTAIEKIENRRLLRQLAASTDIGSVRKAAIERVDDQEILKDVALRDSDASLRCAALKRIEDDRFVGDIVKPPAIEHPTCKVSWADPSFTFGDGVWCVGAPDASKRLPVRCASPMAAGCRQTCGSSFPPTQHQLLDLALRSKDLREISAALNALTDPALLRTALATATGWHRYALETRLRLFPAPSGWIETVSMQDSKVIQHYGFSRERWMTAEKIAVTVRWAPLSSPPDYWHDGNEEERRQRAQSQIYCRIEFEGYLPDTVSGGAGGLAESKATYDVTKVVDCVRKGRQYLETKLEKCERAPYGPACAEVTRVKELTVPSSGR